MNKIVNNIAMLRSTIGILTLSLLIGTMPGCKPKGEHGNQSISPDLVTNPITASGKKATGSLPEIVFEQTKHDFGIMMQGEKLSYTFKFTNTGGSDLIISSVSSSCGCTIADWTKPPVKPGEKGKVEVVFNSAGKTSSQSKTVKVLSNAQPNTIDLEITAEVYVPDSKK
jgi:hypothetical protein